MRGLPRLASNPSSTTTAAAAKQTLAASTSFSSPHAFSTFSGGGGRGRGRGSDPPSKTPPPSRVPGETLADEDDEAVPDDFLSSILAHGRGRPALPSSPILPSFSSLISSLNPNSAGYGRGTPPTSTRIPPTDSRDASDSQPKKPIFFRREDFAPSKFFDPDEITTAPLPPSLSSGLSGAGRGKPTKDMDARAGEENRHLRPRGPLGAPMRGAGARPPGARGGGSLSPPRMGRDEAVKKAVELLSREGGPGRGGVRGGRGGRGRGRGRGVAGFRGRRGRGQSRDADDDFATGLYLGDNSDGEKLRKRLGSDMEKLVDGFEELSSRVLPSPLEEAYLDAQHTNNMIEYEPEYLMEFDTNPDIDEKPPIPLREALEKMKPFLMEYEGIQTLQEWEEIMKETMEKVPHMKELIDIYCGPDRVTAKQQQEELERVAKTLPENIPSSVKRFTDRALLSLQSNPGWGFHQKYQFVDKLVREVSQQYK